MEESKWCFGCEELFNEKFEACFTCSEFDNCRVEVSKPVFNMAVEVEEVKEVISVETEVKSDKKKRLIKSNLVELTDHIVKEKYTNFRDIVAYLMPSNECGDEKLQHKRSYGQTKRAIESLIASEIVNWGGSIKNEICWL